jgi:hypothetical protein
VARRKHIWDPDPTVRRAVYVANDVRPSQAEPGCRRCRVPIVGGQIQAHLDIEQFISTSTSLAIGIVLALRRWSRFEQELSPVEAIEAGAQVVSWDIDGQPGRR